MSSALREADEMYEKIRDLNLSDLSEAYKNDSFYNALSPQKMTILESISEGVGVGASYAASTLSSFAANVSIPRVEVNFPRVEVNLSSLLARGYSALVSVSQSKEAVVANNVLKKEEEKNAFQLGREFYVEVLKMQLSNGTMLKHKEFSHLVYNTFLLLKKDVDGLSEEQLKEKNEKLAAVIKLGLNCPASFNVKEEYEQANSSLSKKN